MIQAVLLAAGIGQRFQASSQQSQPVDKLLTALPDQNTSILAQTANALTLAAPKVLAVVQPQQIARKQGLMQLGVEVIESPLSAKGMGHTIAAGVGASQEACAWLIVLADMPWVSAALMQSLCAAFEHQQQIIIPSYQGQRGHPVLFGAAWRRQLMALTGDRGAKSILDANPACVSELDWPDSSILRDVDVVADLNHKC